jgi:beta-mannosidase
VPVGGVIDATGEPKPVWYALKRAFRPVQVTLVDEGTNGLYVHIINETAEPLELSLELACLRDGSQPVVSGRREMTLGGRDTSVIPATDMFGAFFDTTYAYRFGPPSHDVTVARLYEKQSGAVIAEAFHFPVGRSKVMQAANINATLGNDDGKWFLTLTTDRLAQSVHLDVEGFRPADDWFHLAPGEAKKIELLARSESDITPAGEIRSLGSKQTFRF